MRRRSGKDIQERLLLLLLLLLLHLLLLLQRLQKRPVRVPALPAAEIVSFSFPIFSLSICCFLFLFFSLKLGINFLLCYNVVVIERDLDFGRRKAFSSFC